MSNATKRAEGTAEQVGGKVKGAVGKAVGNDRMEAEGRAQELKGNAKVETAKAGERTKGKAEEIKGAVKSGVGKTVGNDRMRADGKADELKGTARQNANR